MRYILQITVLLLLSACASKTETLEKTGSARFRISLNFGQDLTEAETDSILNTKPRYEGSASQFRDLLVSKKILVGNELDTSGLAFTSLSKGDTVHLARAYAVKLVNDGEVQYLAAIRNGRELRIDIGSSMLGEIFISRTYSRDNGMSHILVLDRHYFMNGYNFDLTLISIR